MNALDELSLVKEAARKLPVFKYVIGCAALLALAGVVIKWGINLPSVLLVGGVLLVGAVALVALNWVARLKHGKANSMALFFGWSTLLLLVAMLVVVFTSAVFDAPWSLRSVIERQLGSATNPVTERSESPPVNFIKRFQYGPDHITLAEYVLENQTRVTSDASEMLRLSHVEFGEIETMGNGFEITFTFTNTSGMPMILDAARKYFRLVDNRGRIAELVDFQAPAPESIVGPGQQRTIRLVFSTPGWSGKSNAASEIYLEVNGFKPVSRASWTIRAMLATAA
jgi:hypothetical protein